MAKISKKMMLFGLVSFLCLGGFAAGQKIADRSKPTGLKPIDAAQVEKIQKNWQRINKIHLNQLGLERVNEVRAKKGQPPLAPSVIRPLGRDLDSEIIREREGMLFAAAPGDEILGDLPPFVDNSLLPYFPPIRDQGGLNSCAPFATTYTQFSYMTAFQKEIDIRDGADNTNKYSPKWTYNMVNGGEDIGSYINDNYELLEKHGAATWAEFPYDGIDYLAWCLVPSAWRNAISTRTSPTQYIYQVNTENGMAQLKELLNNGYVAVFGTFIYSWQGQYIMDDPSTGDDNSEVGKGIGYFVNGDQGSHAMTIVGYNDAIWTDVNGNSVIDPGEKGAFKIANSWGSSWQDAGFVWIAYDALRTESALPDGPSDNRRGGFQGDMVFVLAARDDYSPSMIAEFTVNHARRAQMALSLGISNLAATSPATQWSPAAFANKGGLYAFDGTTTAVDGTFYLDFTDLLTVTGISRKFYLGLRDNASPYPATLSAFKIIDLTTDPETEADSVTSLPIYADGSPDASFAFTQYTFAGDTVNHPPALSYMVVNPPVGTVTDSYYYQVNYVDEDGDRAAIKNLYIDGVAYEMEEYAEAPGWFYYYATLSLGTHNFRFYFTDSRGGAVSEPVSGTYSGPIVTLSHYVIEPATPTGSPIVVSGTSHSYSAAGGTCSNGHSVQYRFDWGDSTVSDWLPVGQVSASHSWSSAGAYGIRAQARCASETSILSDWSDRLVVTVPGSIPFSESFASSGFPQGWIQEHIGTDSYNAWILTPSSEAGGQPYEMICEFEDVVSGTTRLVTAPINTTGYTSLRLRFRHFIRAWDGGGVQFRIQTSTDRTVWTDEAWTVTVGDADIGPETVDTVLTHNLNSTTTYVAFVITGDLYLFDYWHIDDVSLTRATSARVDFNGDGEEDILWRYYGAGVYQGWTVIWYMNQAGLPAPLRLESNQNEPGKMNLLTRSTPSNYFVTPLEVGNPQSSVPNKSSRTPMVVGKPMVLKPAKFMRNPDIGRSLFTRGRGRAGDKDLVRLPTLQDEAKISPKSSGTMKIATLKPVGEAYFPVISDTAWEIAGAGDFNGDGKTDILWRYYGSGYYQGWNIIWYMNGTTITSQEYPPVISDTNWRVDGTGDFDGDGKADMLWRYYGTGYLQGWDIVWYMNGTTIKSQEKLTTISDTNWRIVNR